MAALEVPPITKPQEDSPVTKVKKVILKLGTPPPKSLEGGKVAGKGLNKRTALTNKSPQCDDIREVQNPAEPDDKDKDISQAQTQAQSDLAPISDVSNDVSGSNTDLQRNQTDVAETVAQDLLSTSPPLLTDVITLDDPSVDIHERIAHKYGDDAFYSKILANPAAFKNFEVSNGRIFLKDKGKRTLCVPDIKIGQRRVTEVIISHAHSILAHLGPSKTLLYLRENVWWK
ncbi:hypothetical protein C8R48DRAFT_596567, partial [Suillus tomentosus]